MPRRCLCDAAPNAWGRRVLQLAAGEPSDLQTSLPTARDRIDTLAFTEPDLDLAEDTELASSFGGLAMWAAAVSRVATGDQRRERIRHLKVEGKARPPPRMCAGADV